MCDEYVIAGGFSSICVKSLWKQGTLPLFTQQGLNCVTGQAQNILKDKQVARNNRFIFFTIVLLALFGIFTYIKMGEGLRSIARSDLEKTLRANAESMLQFLSNKKSEINIVTRNTEVVKLSLMLSTPNTP